MALFRLECDGVGIYEAVDKSCPPSDGRRDGKPDGAWLKKVGADYPGSVSFFTDLGFKKYCESQLFNWHMSVVTGSVKLMIARECTTPLYQDDFQVIAKREDFPLIKSIKAQYHGEHPYKVAKDERPRIIRQVDAMMGWSSLAWYPQSDETFSVGANMAAQLGLSRHAANLDLMPPKTRSSWPHAHLVEEEMVLVLEGNPDFWVDGHLYPARPGDIGYFKPGVGHAHCMINRTEEKVKLLVLGEQDKEVDQIFYPCHEERNEECRQTGFFWTDHPKWPLGDQSADPKETTQLSETSQERPSFLIHFDDIEPRIAGKENDPDHIFYTDIDAGRFLKTERLGLHLVKLKPGYRCSLPHAESAEEEFIFVVKGSPIAWIDGKRYQLSEGDAVGFASGTGIHHTFLNETDSECEMIMTGERSKKENKCAFALNPELKEEVKDFFWDNPPVRKMGTDSPIPQIKK